MIASAAGTVPCVPSTPFSRAHFALHPPSGRDCSFLCYFDTKYPNSRERKTIDDRKRCSHGAHEHVKARHSPTVKNNSARVTARDSASFDTMNDLAFYAYDILEGLVNLAGVFIFFIFILPPFLIVFIPLLLISSVVVISGVGLYITYVFCGISWELVRNSLRRLWTGAPANPKNRRRRRPSSYKRPDLVVVAEGPELERERRLSGLMTPSRRIAQPRSRSNSIHLKRSESLRSLVGPSSDHDFEDTGGWAHSREDDEAMYMARSAVGVGGESIYSPVLYQSTENLLGGMHTPQGARTPASLSRPVSRAGGGAGGADAWKFTAGGNGSTTPKAHRSGSVTPESYFSMPTMAAQGKGFLVMEPPNHSSTSYMPLHRKTASGTSISNFIPENNKGGQRDSGFFS